MSTHEQRMSTVKGKQTSSKKKGLNLLSALRRDRSLYMLALPGVLFFLIFKYIPM